MTLIKSISGIRGTVGGKQGEGINPIDIVKFTNAFVELVKKKMSSSRVKLVVGRDGRVSGPAINNIICGTLQMCGADVVNLGLSTTPTVEMAVTYHKADGGIIITASHNPTEWNALKLLNEEGEFISAEEGEELLQTAENNNFLFPDVHNLGNYQKDHQAIDRHIDAIINLPFVDRDAIAGSDFKVAFDSVNSTGGLAIPVLLKELGVENIIGINEEVTGKFAHNPEPLPENLTEIAKVVVEKGADIGFVVDPDVDRLAIVCENGELFGEEYTLVAIADYILSLKPGNTVSNLSSTRALKDVTLKYNKQYSASAVGEVNVVELMKKTDAVIGGEGNGGVILPELHYGRDALVGIALFLTQLAKSNKKVSSLRKDFPDYAISKNKIALKPGTDTDLILKDIAKDYSNEKINTIDGVKIDFEEGWVHLRKSNTEPIIRIYAESKTEEQAEALAMKVIAKINKR